MKILLVYPKFPETFWSFKYALKFISKKSTNPPLGLLTVASMLPEKWEKKLVDTNVNTLKDKDIKWADFVFVSAMSIQKESVKEIIGRCKALNTKIVAGGPLFSSHYDEFDEIDHLILNEAEITLPLFLEDLENGYAKHIYTTSLWADVRKTPIPNWKLINIEKYATMDIQYSRGCPFNCEFCDITSLYGHTPRTKDTAQVLAELESLYLRKWRGGVFFVDDNFIGNKGKLKKDVLPAVIEWMAQRRYPFTFATQASINLSDDDELMDLMVQAGFNTVFVGIETPDEKSLEECGKFQNKSRNLIDCVKKIQKTGLQVEAGFIVGFDNDQHTIFERQIEFIQKSGIVTAMVGLLNALRGTRLYNRLEQENRLLKSTSGNNTDASINFVTKMHSETLINGYRKILKEVYTSRNYYARVKEFLKNYKPSRKGMSQFRLYHAGAFIRSVVRLGIIGKERIHYWKLFFWTIFRRPRLFPLAITFAIYGFHFRKISEKYW